jgi:tetratricopeptide (TPR) repeat protein
VQVNEAGIVNGFGTLAYGQGDYQKARAYFEESLTLYGNLGVWWSMFASVGLAYMNLRQGDIPKARIGFKEVIHRAHKENYLELLLWTTEGLASLQVDQKQFACATRLFAWIDSMREKLRDSRPFIEQTFYERDLAVIHISLDEVEFAEFSEEGRAMTLDQAVALAMESP